MSVKGHLEVLEAWCPHSSSY